MIRFYIHGKDRRWLHEWWCGNCHTDYCCRVIGSWHCCGRLDTSSPRRHTLKSEVETMLYLQWTMLTSHKVVSMGLRVKKREGVARHGFCYCTGNLLCLLNATMATPPNDISLQNQWSPTIPKRLPMDGHQTQHAVRLIFVISIDITTKISTLLIFYDCYHIKSTTSKLYWEVYRVWCNWIFLVLQYTHSWPECRDCKRCETPKDRTSTV